MVSESGSILQLLTADRDEVVTVSRDRRLRISCRQILELEQTPWQMIDTTHYVPAYDRVFKDVSWRKLLAYQRDHGPLRATAYADGSWVIEHHETSRQMSFGWNFNRPAMLEQLRAARDYADTQLADGTKVRRWLKQIEESVS